MKEWLIWHDAYTLHKPVRKKFSRMYHDVLGIDQVWEADLISLIDLKSYTDGVSYILVVIDILSEFAWDQPLRDETGREVTKAFEKILEEHREPFMLQTDRGKEFVNSVFQKFFRDNDIRFRVVLDPSVKVACIEGFNRSSKERPFRFLSHNNTHRHVDVVRKIINAYN